MKKSKILKLAIFATGVSGIVAEYILSTLATYFLGNSVLQWTMIVSIMLFSMGLGARFSSKINGNLLKKFIFIEFLLSTVVAFSSLIVYSSSIYSDIVGILIYIMAIFIGLLIGMEIPLVMRINEEFQSLKSNVSSILENDYYGSLVGGAFFAFVGLPYLGLTYTPFILGFVNLFVAVLLFYYLYKEIDIKSRKQIFISLASVVCLITVGVFVSKPIIKYGEQVKYKDTVVFSKQTKYQKIVITQWKDDYWLYINGNQQLSSFDEELYHEPLVHPIMSLYKHPQDILVLGGGDGCAVRELLKYPSVKNITLVDLDPEMTNLGKDNPIMVDMNNNSMHSEKLTILNTDGYNFIENTDKYFDVIIIDLPDPKTIELSRLYSYEFYKKCNKQLRKQGMIITQAGSPYFANDAFICIDKTIEKAGFTTMRLHNQILTLGEWGWIMGAKSIQKENLKKELLSLEFEGLDTKWINNDAMKLMTSFGKDFYRKQTDSININSIHKPVLSDYYKNGAWDLY
ncbi:MAG: polyamine aminopropyltransferase [Flavobacteriaceae bacterium]|nr:polyamine aminopropyltransferase [Flavobacteriaceae bacterium]